ncbi:MAG: hypothetical protein E7222_09075 [Clostridiales bacterium]|nr:hypothetical protein [Clostridiales bacterium]
MKSSIPREIGYTYVICIFMCDRYIIAFICRKTDCSMFITTVFLYAEKTDCSMAEYFVSRGKE